MIVVLDYGVGNLRSVSNMLRKAGADVRISSDPADVAAADKLLLPGVGHFDHGMRMLRKSGLKDVIDQFVLEDRKPVLGICLGAQILGRGSEEGDEPGLGWVDMECRRLPESDNHRVPHMGWNQLDLKRASPLFPEPAPDSRYYFVHSYYMVFVDPAEVVATTRHGIEFTCAVQHNNVFGTQFHPEKSLRHGLEVMRAFAAL
jgi:imidazole glycerol-phosphate synthase subunit HisH